MITTSSYTAVVEALIPLLREELDSDVQVLRGAPSRLMGRDNVLIGGIEKGSHVFPVARPGRKPRDEQYWLVINVVVRRNGPDPSESETRALELLAALENVIAEQPSLGIEATLRCNIEEFEMDSFVEDQSGWRTLLVAKVQVKTRLT